MTPDLRTSTWRSVLNRRLTVALDGAVDRAVALPAARRGAPAHRRARQLRQHRSPGTDLDRRRAQRPGAVAALFGVPYRQRHQQRLMEEPAGAGRASAQVAWVVPLSLGDSHRGFRGARAPTPATSSVSATATAQPLGVRAQGKPFGDLFEAVVGAEVAAGLGYRVGQQLTLAHGARRRELRRARRQAVQGGGRARAHRHAGRPHGARRACEAIEAIHLDWQGGAPMPGLADHRPSEARKFDLSPEGRDRGAGRPEDPRRGVPGAALRERVPRRAVDGDPAGRHARRAVGVDRRRRARTAGGVGAGGGGRAGRAGRGGARRASNERRRELAILRSLGAGPRHVFLLLASESLLLAALGVCWASGSSTARPWCSRRGSSPASD